MGSFEGHALPGSFFIVFSLWWTVQMFRRYFACTRRCTIKPARPPAAATDARSAAAAAAAAAAGSGSHAVFTSSVTFPMSDLCCCGPMWLRHWEWEGFIKVFFAIVGFIGEVQAATDQLRARFSHWGNGQHATMFFSFGLHPPSPLSIYYYYVLPYTVVTGGGGADREAHAPTQRYVPPPKESFA